MTGLWRARSLEVRIGGHGHMAPLHRSQKPQNAPQRHKDHEDEGKYSTSIATIFFLVLFVPLWCIFARWLRHKATLPATQRRRVFRCTRRQRPRWPSPPPETGVHPGDNASKQKCDGPYTLTSGHPPSLSGRHASAGEIVASWLQKVVFRFAPERPASPATDTSRASPGRPRGSSRWCCRNH